MKQWMVLVIVGMFALGFALPGIPQANQNNFGGGGVTVSGAVVAGHAATFVNSSTIQDGGAAPGSGTVTASGGALTANAVVLGAGTTDTKVSTGITTNGVAELDLGVAGTNGVLGLKGLTSGTATLTAPATAGTSTNPILFSNVIQVPAGALATAGIAIGAANDGMFQAGAGDLRITATGVAGLRVAGTFLQIPSNSGLLISSGAIPSANDVSVARKAVGVLGVGTGAVASSAGLIQSGMTVFVTGNFTTSGVGTALEAITGLSWTFPATALNWPFHCHLSYSQAVGSAAVAFGIKATTNNPTNIFAHATQQITVGPPATIVTGTLATLATTTATNIVTGTPTATATNYVVDIDGMLELPASAVSVGLMTSTATAADLVTVLRGSYCSLNP